MKVLHVIPGIAARDGGPSEAAVQICNALASTGVDTTLAFTVAAGDDEHLLLAARFTLKEFPRFGSQSLKYSPSLSHWLRQNVSDFDVVHVHAIFSHSSIAAMRFARRASIPFVLRPLGSLAPYSLHRRPFRKALALRLGLRRLIECAAAIHCTSAEEEQEVRAAFDVRTFTIPNGVDERLFDIGEDARERTVVFIGRLHEKKNCEVLIAAFQRYSASHPDATLLIAGDGEADYVKRLRQLAAAGSSIRFPGWITGDERIDLLRRASVFVLPSAHENFGIAAAEAMAAGVRVIVSPAVNLAADIERAGAGWVVAPVVDELSRAIGDALDGGERATEKARNGRRLAADRFRWNVIAQSLAAQYTDLM